MHYLYLYVKRVSYLVLGNLIEVSPALCLAQFVFIIFVNIKCVNYYDFILVLSHYIVSTFLLVDLNVSNHCLCVWGVCVCGGGGWGVRCYVLISVECLTADLIMVI